ncbi:MULTISPECIES: hypothetical protein [unclassified Kribbella]
MSEWFALRPTVVTEAPVPKRATEPVPPADPDAEVTPPSEDAPADE